MNKLTRCGCWWEDKEKTIYVWLEEHNSFQNQETGELFEIKEGLNDDEVIVK